MANAAQYVALVLAVALLGGGGYAMYTFFGPVGVVLLVVFALPAISIPLYLGNSGGGESAATNQSVSKGMQEER